MATKNVRLKWSGKTKLNMLSDDVLEQIRVAFKNPPPHLNLFDVIYFQYIKLNTKLINIEIVYNLKLVSIN